ncbi:MAG TPA: translation initiation factor IF-2 [Verrucomicrobiae bacterium]|nr:translation initiation factor IF-2 [Verrucomicrobiae bacterium]
MPEQTAVKIPGVLTVKQLADALNQPVTLVIGKLMQFGVLATINEDIDFDTAAIVADDFGILVEREIDPSQEQIRQEDMVSNTSEVTTRPPIVTIMGHVDHGKTSLLDKIRSTNVAGGESGGITQHISSYQIEIAPKAGGEKRVITFLDTPGHSAFEAMRRHGARITDLVVLVVAADDGIKPQTVEAINHARAMSVPVLVAINKIDKTEADLDKVKAQLAEHNLVPEDWGGKTITVPVSAMTGEGLDDLLEMILLSTDLRELKANLDVPAVGVVVESNLKPGVGPVATVLIQNGTLRTTHYVAMGDVSGRVRTLTDHRGRRINEATPSMPVEISGLSGVPQFGEQMMVFEVERDAKEAARTFLRSQSAKRAAGQTIAIQSAGQKEGQKTILTLVVKADAKGSLEAIRDQVSVMKNEDVEVRVVSDGIGDISEGDITMASTAKAPVIGFHVRIPSAVKQLADREKVSVTLFSVIYELFDAIRSALAELMPEITIEEELAKLQILARFRDNRKRVVVGGRVEDGTLTPKQLVKVMRGKEVLAQGKLITVRRGKDEVRQVLAGSECGIELDLTGEVTDIKEGDTVVLYRLEKQKKPLGL